jgi:hypothetical protein
MNEIRFHPGAHSPGQRLLQANLIQLAVEIPAEAGLGFPGGLMAREAIHRNGNGIHPIRKERRQNLRITAPFPVRVRGISPSGRHLEFETEVENLGSGGLFMRTPHDIRAWKNLTLVMRLALTSEPETPAPVVAARARILRTEHAYDGCAGYAVAFTRSRFV